VAHSLVVKALSLTPPEPGTTLIDLKGPWALPVLALLLIGLVWEILRLSRTPASSVRCLSPHAVPTFAAMVLGIATALLIANRLGLAVPRVDCSGDIYRG
jgi:hypothetical protein